MLFHEVGVVITPILQMRNGETMRTHSSAARNQAHAGVLDHDLNTAPLPTWLQPGMHFSVHMILFLSNLTHVCELEECNPGEPSYLSSGH